MMQLGSPQDDKTFVRRAECIGIQCSRWSRHLYNGVNLNASPYPLPANPTTAFFQIRLNQHTCATLLPSCYNPANIDRVDCRQMSFSLQESLAGPIMNQRLLPTTVVCSLIALTAQGAPEPPPLLTTTPPIEEREEVGQLFTSMRQGSYTDRGFPRLVWGDIPALLNRGESTVVLHAFPRNNESSQFEPACTEGMVALWLVEGIRQGSRHPSLTALCLKQGPTKGPWSKQSEENHPAVARAYRAWWRRVQYLPPKRVAKMDPLHGTQLHWY